MSDLKSEHLWPIVEQTREHCFNDALGVPNFVAWAMLDDLHTLRQQLIEAQVMLEPCLVCGRMREMESEDANNGE